MNLEVRPSLEKFNIRKLTEEDADKYREIRLKGLETDPQGFGSNIEEESQKDDEFWKRRLGNPERSFYVAEEGDKFVSTAASRKLDQDNYIIMAVYTLPEFRGKNLSTQLINQLISDAKQKGVKKMSLHVKIDNENAIKVYEKIGFKITEVYEQDGKITDSYTMEKDIAQ